MTNPTPEIHPYLALEVPLADLAGVDAVGWRHQLEDRIETALADLGVENTGGGTGFGRTDASFTAPLANFEAAYIRLGAFLASQADVPGSATVDVVLPDGRELRLTVGSVRQAGSR